MISSYASELLEKIKLRVYGKKCVRCGEWKPRYCYPVAVDLIPQNIPKQIELERTCDSCAGRDDWEAEVSIDPSEVIR